MYQMYSLEIWAGDDQNSWDYQLLGVVCATDEVAARALAEKQDYGWLLKQEFVQNRVKIKPYKIPGFLDTPTP